VKGKQFYQYYQNEQPPITLNHWVQKYHDNQCPAWDICTFRTKYWTH